MATPLTSDEYFAGVGRIIHYYQLTENCMFVMFAYLLATKNPDTPRALFYAIDSLSGRRALLQRVVTARRGPEFERRLVDDLMRAMEKANAQRRLFAHVHIHPNAEKFGVAQVFFKDITTRRGKGKGAPMKRVSRKALELAVRTVHDCFKAAEAAVIELWTLGGEAQQKSRSKRARGSPRGSRRQKTQEPLPAEFGLPPEVTSESG